MLSPSVLEKSKTCSDSHSEPGLDDEESFDSEQHSSQIELMELDNDPIHVDTACLSTVPDESAVSTSATTTTTTTKSSTQSTLSSFIPPKENPQYLWSKYRVESITCL